MWSVSGIFGGVPGTAARLLLPRSCVGCGAAQTWWCGICAQGAVPDPVVRALPGTNLVVAAAVPYENPARRAILAHKDRQVTALRGVLLAWLVEALRIHPATGPGAVLVPVPPSRRSRLSRGRDPLAEVVGAAVKAGFALAVDDPLRWSRQPLPQKGLDRQSRAENVAGALAARRAPAGPVLLADDVTTTGATLAEAERALRRAGAGVVGAIAMCYTR